MKYDLDAVVNKLKDTLSNQMVIIVDDSEREKEADIVVPACRITWDILLAMEDLCNSVVTIAMNHARVSSLNLQSMIRIESDDDKDAFFTNSIDLKGINKSGASLLDRSETMRALSQATFKRDDFRSPGHVFPLMAHKHGLRGRCGHTESSIALMEISGLPQVAVLGEICDRRSGIMATFDTIQKLSIQQHIPMCNIDSIMEYLKI